MPTKSLKTRHENQLEATKQQHRDLIHDEAAASITLHTILLGVGGYVYTPHMFDPLKKLGLISTRLRSMASSSVSTLYNMLTNLLAPDALLRKALITTTQ